MYHTLKIGAGQKIRFGLNGSLKLVMHAYFNVAYTICKLKLAKLFLKLC